MKPHLTCVISKIDRWSSTTSNSFSTGEEINDELPHKWKAWKVTIRDTSCRRGRQSKSRNLEAKNSNSLALPLFVKFRMLWEHHFVRYYNIEIVHFKYAQYTISHRQLHKCVCQASASISQASTFPIWHPHGSDSTVHGHISLIQYLCDTAAL